MCRSDGLFGSRPVPWRTYRVPAKSRCFPCKPRGKHRGAGQNTWTRGERSAGEALQDRFNFGLDYRPALGFHRGEQVSQGVPVNLASHRGRNVGGEAAGADPCKDGLTEGSRQRDYVPTYLRTRVHVCRLLGCSGSAAVAATPS